MNQKIDADAAWAAITGREREADGRFVFGVTSTGIYCRPSCPARRPRRESVRLFVDGPAAQQAGFRACLRCRPDDIGRDTEAVARAVELIEAALAAEEAVPPLAALAQATGYSPTHFQRVFTRALGLSPAAWARARRHARADAALAEGAGVTEAVYAAGYGGPSRFYEGAGTRLGMAPRRAGQGGAGETIGWVVAQASLGPVLVAATERGICRVAFGEGEAQLAARFPNAELVEGGGAMADIIAQALSIIENPARPHNLPLDVRGTAFQEAVWRALRQIPPGETRSYAQIAAAAGHPGATRAAGSANGANPVAVLVPCHRVIRGDGSLGGYAWGLDIKAGLLAREASNRGAE